MSIKPPYKEKIGYTRREFNAIFQIYSQNVYSGLFKDFSFNDLNGRYFISFREEAGQTPLITIEKRKLSADRVLFIATTPTGKETPQIIARSEKIESFIQQVKGRIAILTSSRNHSNKTSKKGNLS